MFLFLLDIYLEAELLDHMIMFQVWRTARLFSKEIAFYISIGSV